MARFIVFVLIGVMFAVLVIASITVHRASAATIATDTPVAPTIDTPSLDLEAEAPREVMLGRFMLEPYMVREGGTTHGGGRFGADMIIASGEGRTRLASGIRFLLGGDGASRFGTEGQSSLA